MEALPLLEGKGSQRFLVDDDIDAFVARDLDFSRLNCIHSLLWMAGRPLPARALHRYRVMGFTPLPTLQADLHLLRFEDHILVKPLPEYLLDYDFWVAHLCGGDGGGGPALHAAACGVLVSYIWLVTAPLDLRVAHEHGLLPSFVTWGWWRAFAKDVVAHLDLNALDQVNPRFQFGDLRLSRINSIYRIRFAFTNFVRGYLYSYNRYVAFFQRNFSWILIVFVFVSLVLSAMQVGVGVEPLQDNRAFLNASYGFVVFSMLVPAAILAIVGVVYCVVFFFNMVAAIAHVKQARKARSKLAHDRAKRKDA